MLARDLYAERLPGDEPEELEVVPWKLDALHELILREDFSEGRSIAALFIAREWLRHACSCAMSCAIGRTLREGVDRARARGGRRDPAGLRAATSRSSTRTTLSPLTAADLAAHRCIVDGLAAADAGHPGAVGGIRATTCLATMRRAVAALWLVDPLDGTREFVKRNGEFTVNIALIEDGVPVFGVVQAPVTGELWHGARGVGAFRRDGDARRCALRVARAGAPRRCASPPAARIAIARTQALLRTHRATPSRWRWARR